MGRTFLVRQSFLATVKHVVFPTYQNLTGDLILNATFQRASRVKPTVDAPRQFTAATVTVDGLGPQPDVSRVTTTRK